MLRTLLRPLGLLSAVAISLPGCADPDPETRFDEFLEESESFRGGSASACNGSDWGEDLTGPYFMALRNPVIPTLSLYFETSFEIEDAAERRYTISMQPLKTDFDIDGNERADARTPVGDPIVVRGATMTSDGLFDTVNFLRADGIPEACFPDPSAAPGEECEVIVPGDANPISYADIFATLDLSLCVYDLDTGFCGTITSGRVSRPQAVSLENQPFNAVVAEDYTAVTPTPNCPEGALAEPEEEEEEA